MREHTLTQGEPTASEALPAHSRASALTRRSVWPQASLVALASCCAIDLLAPPKHVSLGFLASLLGLGSLLALLHGAAWAFAFGTFRRLPPALARGACFLASLSAHAFLALRLGAFTRLHSRYAGLAVAVLLACTLSSLGFGALAASLQPTAAEPSGLAFALSIRRRRLLALLLLMAAGAMLLADRRFFPQLYPIAHGALQLGTLVASMFGLGLIAPRVPKIEPALWILALVGFGSCLWLLDQRSLVILNAFKRHAFSADVLALSRNLVDFDRDGRASFLGDSDCAPFDARVYPGAPEIPDNGLDDNCMLGDATTQAHDFAQVPLSNQPPALDVVLITVDALNPRHMGLYNPSFGPSGRATTPNLDRWAEQASVFEHAYSPGGWTSIALPSMLRGVYARKLAWLRYYETNFYAMFKVAAPLPLRAGEQLMHVFPLAWGDPHPSLAEMMKRRGYVTAAVTADGYSAMLARGTGIERGFDRYRELDELPEPQQDDAGSADLALQVLATTPSEARLFLWVHFFGTHWPTSIHPGIRQYGGTPEDEYDHEVAYADSQLIRLLEAIEARGRPTAIFVTADHGEAFNASTPYHGYFLDEATIRVPLLAKVPGWSAGRKLQLTSTLDLVPTILSLIGAPVPAYLDGVDLNAPWKEARPRALLSDTWRYEPPDRLVSDFAAVFDGSRKYTLERQTGALYEVDQSDLHALHGELVKNTPSDRLSKLLFTYIEESGGIQLSN